MKRICKDYNVNDNNKGINCYTLVLVYLNNNTRKLSMAEKEQLNLCATQVNKHKWKRNVQNNFRSFQDKCLYFKINDYETTLYTRYDKDT